MSSSVGILVEKVCPAEQILLGYCGSLLLVNVLLALSLLPAAGFGHGMGWGLNCEEKDLLENGPFHFYSKCVHLYALESVPLRTGPSCC